MYVYHEWRKRGEGWQPVAVNFTGRVILAGTPLPETEIYGDDWLYGESASEYLMAEAKLVGLDNLRKRAEGITR